MYTWVPVDRGTLLKSMLKSITGFGGSQLHSFPYLVIINTKGASHGNTANKMPTSWLKHGGSGDIHAMRRRRRKSRHDGHMLHDPKAISGFYSHILRDGRKYAKKLYKQFRRKLFEEMKNQLGMVMGGTQISRIAGSALTPFYSNRFE